MLDLLAFRWNPVYPTAFANLGYKMLYYIDDVDLQSAADVYDDTT